MTKQAVLRQADLRRMAKIAKQDGVKVEIERYGLIIRVSAEIDTEQVPANVKELRL